MFFQLQVGTNSLFLGFLCWITCCLVSWTSRLSSLHLNEGLSRCLQKPVTLTTRFDFAEVRIKLTISSCAYTHTYSSLLLQTASRAGGIVTRMVGWLSLNVIWHCADFWLCCAYWTAPSYMVFDPKAFSQFEFSNRDYVQQPLTQTKCPITLIDLLNCIERIECSVLV